MPPSSSRRPPASSWAGPGEDLPYDISYDDEPPYDPEYDAGPPPDAWGGAAAAATPAGDAAPAPAGAEATSAAPLRRAAERVGPAPTPLEVLREVWGYEAFRGEQAAIIDTVVAGGDALVLMPTGSGKSLCYQVPALVRPGTGVVVSPLIALMQDQVDALSAAGVRAGFLNSTQEPAQRRQVERAYVSGELDLLYLAPERLRAPSTLEQIGRAHV